MSSVARRLGFETITLDNDPKMSPAILVDILSWDYESSRWGVFDFVHASIPCQELSQCHTRSERNLDHARKIASRTREIIEYFLKRNARLLFFVENPSTSLLCREAAVQGWMYNDASYCCYGFPYRKNTRFWHNLPALALQTCSPEHCFWLSKGHPLSCQHAPPDMRAKIPACLCLDILTQACAAMGITLCARVPCPVRPTPRTHEQPGPTRRKRGRPRATHDSLSCSICGVEEAFFYNLKRGPVLCSRCYRRTRRQAKAAAAS